MHNSTRLYPQFSIITVTYNAEKVLEDTIQSVVSQTYTNIEYLIIDGNNENCPTIPETYPSSYQ